MTNIDPPPYETKMAEEATPSGFPTGYFVIQNRAAGRLLDVARSSSQDGTEIVLWEDKDKSRVMPMRSPSADNQVFFVDHNGALCSKASGHAVDIEGIIPVLRHRKPFTSVPSAESHPLPRITYASGVIRVAFNCDPKYPDSPDPTNAWRSKDFILSAVPVCKSPTFLDNALDVVSAIGASFSKPQSLVSGPYTTGHASAPASASDFALLGHEVMEEERVGKEDDVDDSPEPGRPVHMLELPIGWRDKEGANLSAEARLRRQWEVIRISDHKRRTGHRES